MGTEEYIKYIIYLGIGWERWYRNRRVYKVYNIPWYRLGKMVWELWFRMPAADYISSSVCTDSFLPTFYNINNTS